jgi:O-antigen/teichoic acid export membrane protein
MPGDETNETRASRTPGPGRAAAFVRFALGLSTRGLEAAGKFGLYALAVAWLGESPAGLFFLALTVQHLGATAARLGTERILARNTAAYLASGQAQEARGTIFAGLALNAAASGFVALVLAVWPAPLARLLGAPELAPLLSVLVIGLPGQAMAYAAGYILIGLGRPILAQLIMNAAPPVAALAALVLGVRGAEPVLLIYSLAAVVGFAGALVVIVGDLWRAPARRRTREDRLPGVLSGLRSFYWVELIQAGIIGAPMIFLAHAVSTAEVGAFSLANRLSMLVVTLVVSLGAMASANLAAHLRLGDDAALRRDVRRLGTAAQVAGLPAILALALGGPWLLSALGVTAAAAAPVLALLALSQAALVLFPARDVLLASAGHDRTLRNLNVLQAGVMLIGCLALIPAFGLWGAGIAAATCWTAGPLVTHFVARKRLPQAFLRASVEVGEGAAIDGNRQP